MASRKIGKIFADKSVLFLCDMQDGFRKTIKYFPQILEVSNRMLGAAKALDIPVVVTEQYPKGLGPTAKELDVTGLPVFPKTKFSMLIPEVEDYLKNLNKEVDSVIICGIETQACVQQTALGLLEKGKDVHVIVDACSSRSMPDRMFAYQRMKDAGAFLTTSEGMLLNLCQDAKHPKFKQIQKLIWDEAPDSGLLTHMITGATEL
ncbi:isochorismatase domain-containing protein 2-like isoform X2 [Lineus longissimus]|uniref:isochorismatase domain-containing protein 2-like isoform X2 n=1 Tax=Lineus longissimus TaxID=88925 RepID=UPI002B4F1D70